MLYKLQRCWTSSE